MSYDKVTIHNSTPYNASGTVEYASIFCRNDDYNVTTNTTWEASSRGVCLLTGITATLVTPSGPVTADAYDSAGTTYSRFAVISTGDNTFAVTRITQETEDHVPSDYVEPTEQQK
ncbi:MAG: hypothetical protein NTV28_01285 [Propionibacteriales bacterium]|nr:hypothetical protein [Propionibacteriales bacterium]